MDARTKFAALALAGLVVLAGCTGAIGGSPDDQQSDPNAAVQQADGDGDGATVVVGGEGSVEAEPDAATVRLTVRASGEDPETVRDRLSRNATAAREALLEFGLDEEQVHSERFRIRENRRAKREPDAEEDPYVGTHRLVVDLDDVDAVGKVIDAAVQSGPVHVDDVQFGLSDERREQLRDRALTEAVEDARSEAELVAAAEDLQVGSAERITTDRVEVGGGSGTVVREAAATPTAQADAASTRVESDDVTVTASVQVVYNATVG
jgi:uncharacterized protein YggE